MSSLPCCCPVRSAPGTFSTLSNQFIGHELSSASYSRLSPHRPVLAIQHSKIFSSPSCRTSPKLGHLHSFGGLSLTRSRPVQIPPSFRTQTRPLFCTASSGGTKSANSSDYRQKAAEDIRVLVVGSTGYIGKFVTKELIKRGFHVIAGACCLRSEYNVGSAIW